MTVFEAKELQNSSETALCYRQTIPHEILHLVNYEPTQINEGPKMALMRPHPLSKSPSIFFFQLRNWHRHF